MLEHGLLIHHQQCLVCLAPKLTVELTNDHIIAKSIGQDHPDAFRELIANHRNIAKLCVTHHIEVDKIKLSIYKTTGLPGFIDYLMDGYPRSPASILSTILDFQINYLLKRLYDNTKPPKSEDKPEDKRDDKYDFIHDQLHPYLAAKGLLKP